MANTIKRYPEIGDIAISVGGKVRFLGQDATEEFVNKQQCIGVVYNVRGREVSLVWGCNNRTEKWSSVYDFEITGIPAMSKDCEVKLQSAVVGTMHYNRVTGTIDEFVQQLNEWLSVNAPKWEAYMYQGKGILQLSDYTSSEGDNSINGCTLDPLVGKEISFTDGWNAYRNQVKQSVSHVAINTYRVKENAQQDTSKNYNPSKRMDGVTKLYEIFPCSKIYYDGILGDGLRANYDTYEKYIDACGIRLHDLFGTMKYSDGRGINDMLVNKKRLVKGVSVNAYPAVCAAREYDAGVPGFGKGEWHLPSMQELSVLMHNITEGTNEKLDVINISLSKKTGWHKIGAGVSRMSCVRCSTSGYWYYNGNGLTYSGYVYFGSYMNISAVKNITLDYK